MTTHPELHGAEDDDAPLFSARRSRMLRAVVWVGIVALVAPGVLFTWSVAQSTANRACAVYAAYLKPDAGGSDAPFELWGTGGPGWQCYSVSTSGVSTHLGPLGIIPAAPRIPRGGVAT
ncbi:hypothetical protein WDJ51_03060 [Rathayibacter sp. YIM 133350]|uniref:hypothetical protein n=1 Tax=Rathayibacter sp. YIM 133350 TaxID=3131992 RepID=UPI00307F9E97